MAYNTIMLKGENPNIEEMVANAAITPGMLIEEMNTGKVRAHADENGNAVSMWALENEMEGEEITDAYAADDRVRCWHAKRGDQIYALLADGENVVRGDFLASNGDGYLQKFVGGDSGTAEELPLEIVAKAKEAVNRSSSSGGDTNTTGRIVVEAV